MAAQWFCKIMGDEQGPLTAAQLQEIARSGRLGIDDLVRKAGHSTWVRAENVVGLYDQPSLPVVVHESIAVIDDPAVRATWGSTATASAANGQKCSIEVNATTLSGCSISSTATGGTTNRPPHDSASRISSVVVPRRTLKMTVTLSPEATTRNFANRTTRAIGFNSQADTLPNAAPQEDQYKTVQRIREQPPTTESIAERALAEQCV